KIDPTNLETVKLLIKYQAENGLVGDAVSVFQTTMESSEFFPSEKDREEFVAHVLGVLGDHPDVHAILIRENLERENYLEVFSSIEKCIPNVKTKRQVHQLQTLLDSFEKDEGLLKELYFCFILSLLRNGYVEEARGAFEKLSSHVELTGEERERAEEVFQYISSAQKDENLPSKLEDAWRYVVEREEVEEEEEEDLQVSDREGARVEEEPGREGEEDIDSVVTKLREKVEDEIGETDLNARYNLGIAFKEMSLFDEAIREFEVARKDEGLRFPASLLLLECYEALGRDDEALMVIDELLGAGISEQKVKLDLLYQKGNILEKKGKNDEAREIFQEIYSLDSGYKDVAERVESN
ncbi:MAG: hypothetical protein D6713_10840, partial [Deltaproteobacteria bacterium]